MRGWVAWISSKIQTERYTHLMDVARYNVNISIGQLIRKKYVGRCSKS